MRIEGRVKVLFNGKVIEQMQRDMELQEESFERCKWFQGDGEERTGVEGWYLVADHKGEFKGMAKVNGPVTFHSPNWFKKVAPPEMPRPRALRPHEKLQNGDYYWVRHRNENTAEVNLDLLEWNGSEFVALRYRAGYLRVATNDVIAWERVAGPTKEKVLK